MRKLVGILVLTAAGSVAAHQDTSAPRHDAAIAFWTTGYAGSKLGSIGCAAPQLPDGYAPAVTLRKAIKAIETWQDCHRRVIGALAPEAAHKFIPAEVLAAMTPTEREAAIRHVAAVHAKHADTLQADAAKHIAAQQAWRAETKRYGDAYSERLSASRDRHENRDAVRVNEVRRRP